MATGERTNVSTVSIDEAINYLKIECIAKLDDSVTDVLSSYNALKDYEILSSANIDGLANLIKAKITALQNDFDNLATSLQTEMVAAHEDISAGIQSIEHDMNI